MRKKRLQIVIYIFFLLVSAVVILDAPNVVRNLVKEQFAEKESNVLTVDDLNELMKAETNRSDVDRKDYFKVNNKYDGIQVAANEMNISVSGDLVTYYSPESYTRFFYNTKEDKNSAINILNAGGSQSGNYGYLSLPNGTYWFYGYSVNSMSLKKKGPVTISNSCQNQTKDGQTGTFSVQRCFKKDKYGNVTAYGDGTIGTCAANYKMENKKVTSDGCAGVPVGNGLEYRFCKATIEATCTKEDGGGENPTPPTPNPPGPTVPAPSLTSLSVSSGSLSPGFKSSTYSYTVNVDSTITSINVTGSLASGSSFVGGLGPRTVNLNYGSNPIKLKVQNTAGRVVTYTVNVNRADNRSSVNTLSNLTINKGKLEPKFYSSVNEYTIEVDSTVSAITVDATLTDTKSSFAPGAGPGSYDLIDGPNKIYIKVVSESGLTNIYTLTVNRAAIPSECTTNAEDYGLLKDIELSVETKGVEVDQIEDFDPKIFNYNGIKLNYKITNLTVNAYAKDDADADNIEIEGADDLEVNVPRVITIRIKSAYCGNVENEYTVEVTRQPEVTKSDNPELESITIDGYDLEFKKEVLSYGIKLKKGDTELKITAKPVDSGTECNIVGNHDLKVGSQIDIKCVSESGEEAVNYNISIDGVEKGTNVFIIIIVVIAIIILLVYLLLRLLGYKLVFNTSVIGAFFRGIGEKFQNTFDK